MAWRSSVPVVLAVGLLTTLAFASDDNTAEKCIRSSPEARYRGLGYNHIVHVSNVCKVSAECDVSTDVNPQPTHVTVAGGEKVEVSTFLGSPARVFVPNVVCVMQH
jgi:hypothetical protein